MCSDLIKVRVAGADLTVNLEDISPSGACLQAEEPLEPGAPVLLICRRRRFRGRVIYCVRHEIGYFAGIRFDAGQRWSRADYEPKHLLGAVR